MLKFGKRSNYSEPSAPYAALGIDDDDEEAAGGRTSKSRARQTISDKRDWGRKKKSTMNVRTAVLYKKNLTTLIEESVRLPHSSLCEAHPI
jgi:zinc finger HIT domain-containing protein 1